VGVPPVDAEGHPHHAWVTGTTKGVGDPESLIVAIDVAASVSPEGRARVTSDLRAGHCPSRRPVIAAAAADLAVRLATPCPTCASPGWGVDGTETGLRCRWCDGPTDEIVAHRWACPACGATDVRSVGTDRRGDPGRCPRCNP